MSAVIKFHMSRSYDTSWCGLNLVLLSATGVDVGIAGRPDAATCIGCLGEAALGGDGHVGVAARARLLQLANAPSSPGLITGKTDAPPPGFEIYAVCVACGSKDVVVCLGIAHSNIAAFVVCESESCGFLCKREMVVP